MPYRLDIMPGQKQSGRSVKPLSHYAERLQNIAVHPGNAALPHAATICCAKQSHTISNTSKAFNTLVIGCDSMLLGYGMSYASFQPPCPARARSSSEACFSGRNITCKVSVSFSGASLPSRSSWPSHSPARHYAITVAHSRCDIAS